MEVSDRITRIIVWFIVGLVCGYFAVVAAVALVFVLTILASFFGWSILLLVLGAVLMVFAIKDVASDIIAARQQAKQGKSNVVPLKREDRA